jgi:transcriptional regulator CtsR
MIMVSKNASDLIEAYLKQLLEQRATIEIKRSDLADNFGVVPSQINYVIKTRFSLPSGYHVVSKRGGGGYIRIEKLSYSTAHDLLQEMYRGLPETLTSHEAETLLDRLCDGNVISTRETKILAELLASPIIEDLQRTQQFKALLYRLDLEND